MDNIKIMCWNVRGQNSRDRRDNVRTLLNEIRATIVCLVETKLHSVEQWLVFSMLGMNFIDYAYVPAANTRGGVLIAARGPDVRLSEPHVGCYSVTVAVSAANTDDRWWLTAIYGPQLEAEKELSLEELAAIRDQCTGPWAIVGDFNLIPDEADKNNSRINRRSVVPCINSVSVWLSYRYLISIFMDVGIRGPMRGRGQPGYASIVLSYRLTGKSNSRTAISKLSARMLLIIAHSCCRLT